MTHNYPDPNCEPFRSCMFDGHLFAIECLYLLVVQAVPDFTCYNMMKNPHISTWQLRDHPLSCAKPVSCSASDSETNKVHVA